MRAVRRPKQKKKNGLRIVIGIIIAILVIAGIAWFVHQQRIKKNYKEGIKSFKSNDYVKAEEYLSKAGDYQDSKKVIQISNVFDALRKEDYQKASDLSKDLSDYSVNDTEVGKSINEDLEGFYIQAKILTSSDQLEDAISIFESLKEYEDSKEATAYYNGILQMKEDNLEEAAKYFDEAKDYDDAEILAVDCRDYLKARELQDKGDKASLEEADILYTNLGDFKDSAARALECRSVALFKKAKAYDKKEKYDEAYKILNEYPDNPYPGWSDLLAKCGKEIEYKKAKKLYKKEHYYQAYKIFDSLGKFKDSKKKKEECIQETPASSVLFQDPEYTANAVELIFKNNGKQDNLIKMYNSEDKLVATVYVRQDGSTSIRIPSDTYHINKAYGVTWFGEKDMYGENGEYTRCKVNGDYDFILNSGMKYTLSTDTGEGDPVTSSGVGADKF